jgi:A/G-specific adenine glycosylase
VNFTLDEGQNAREGSLIAVLLKDGATDEAVGIFRDLILSFYRTCGRDLPWRRTEDPYRILVSEMMLQQTQVDRVVPKYEAFVERFPDFASLAAAPVQDLLAAWQGLGYNRRALSLQKTARRVVEEFSGDLPADVGILSTFPGIGHATASAIAAYAFNMPVAYVETNIRRIFIHFFFQDRENVPDAEILALVQRTLWHENPREWYSALMDYGTVLAKRTANPNRRSAAYARQSRFEGSDRQVRGVLLRCLVAEGEIPEEGLPGLLGVDEERAVRLLRDLEKEGFLAVRSGRVRLAEDREG